MEEFAGYLFIIGGICMFFWGMKYFSSGVGSIVGSKGIFTKNKKPLKKGGYYLVGVVTTAIIQSSDATTILSMNMAKDKLVTKENALSIALGARLGTTITALIASLGKFQISPIILSISLAVSLLLPKERKLAKESLLGLGLFFGGLTILDFGVDMVNGSLQALFQGQSSFFLLFVMGLLITAIFQSSSAVTSVLAILTAANSIGIEKAIFVLLGATIGTTATPLLASIKMDSVSKYIAVTYVLMTFLIGVVGFIICRIFVKPIVGLLSIIPNTLQLAVFGIIYGFISSFCCLLLQTPLEKLFKGVLGKIKFCKNLFAKS